MWRELGGGGLSVAQLWDQLSRIGVGEGVEDYSSLAFGRFRKTCGLPRRRRKARGAASGCWTPTTWSPGGRKRPPFTRGCPSRPSRFLPARTTSKRTGTGGPERPVPPLHTRDHAVGPGDGGSRGASPPCGLTPRSFDADSQSSSEKSPQPTRLSRPFPRIARYERDESLPDRFQGRIDIP